MVSAVPQTTTYMDILLPEVGTGIGYVDDLLTAFTTIDNHNHIDIGKGLTQRSISWSNWDINFYSFLNIDHLNFQSVISANVPNLSLYYLTDSIGTDLFFKDGAANVIRITENGSVTVVSPINGFRGDFQAYNASVVYSAAANSYTFNIQSAPAGLRVNTLHISDSMTGNQFIGILSNTFTISSTGFFHVNSVLCTEGVPLITVKPQSVNIATTVNPRLIQNANQLNNITSALVRPNRFQINQGGSAAYTFIQAATKPTNISRLTVQNGTYYPHGGTTDRDNFNMQNPLQEVAGAYLAPLSYQMGGIIGVKPVFNFTAQYDLLRIQATYNYTAGGTANPAENTANKMLSLSIILPQNTKLNFFREFLLVDTAGTTLIIQASYYIQVLDTTTGNKTNNYYCIARM